MKYLAFLLSLCLLTGRAEAQCSGADHGNGCKLQQQYRLARQYDLSPMLNADTLVKFIGRGILVRIPDRQGFYVDPKMGRSKACAYPYPERLRYARRHVLRFLERESAHLRAKFPRARFKVTGLVRTPYYQAQLNVCNGSSARGGRSPHIYGTVVDISRKGMTAEQVDWMTAHLLKLQNSCQWISLIKERAAFHVFVRPNFGQGGCK